MKQNKKKPHPPTNLSLRIFRLRLLLLFPNAMEDRSLLVVYVFTSTKSPRGPPWNEGHQPKVHHETSVLEVLAQEQHEHSFCSSSSNTFISCSLYTVHRYRTSPGAPDLWRGWADSKAVHGMECSGASSLYWRSLSVGAAARSVLYCQYKEVCSPTRPNAKQANELSTTTETPGPVPGWYI